MIGLRGWLVAVAASSVLGCGGDDGVPAQCHFASGRPCPPGQLCLGSQGDECNYYVCTGDGLIGGAVGCLPGTVAPVAGAPFNCDPATVVHAGTTPPPGPCPISALYALIADRASPYDFCVPVEQCAPLPCDPAFAGDGCPSAHRCDEASRTCVALVAAP